MGTFSPCIRERPGRNTSGVSSRFRTARETCEPLGSFVNMTDRSHGVLVVTLALLTAAAMAMPPRAAAADHRAKYEDLLKNRGAGGVVQAILAAFGGPTAADEIEQLASVLAASPANAAAVLDALAAEKSVEAASVAAELLYCHHCPDRRRPIDR